VADDVEAMLFGFEHAADPVKRVQKSRRPTRLTGAASPMLAGPFV